MLLKNSKNSHVIFGLLFCFVMFPFTVFQWASANQSIETLELQAETEKEVYHSLQRKIATWQLEDFYIEGPHTKIAIPTDYFHFDLHSSTTQFIQTQKKAWYDLFSPKYSGSFELIVTLDEAVDILLEPYTYLSKEQVKEQLVEYAQSLKSGPLQIKESEVVLQTLHRQALVGVQIPVDVTNLDVIMDSLQQYTFHEGEIFSLLQFIENQDISVDAHTLSFVASVLHTASLESSLKVMEYQNQKQLTSYARPGIDVQIDKVQMNDFQLVNVSKNPVILKNKKVGSNYYMMLYSTDDKTKYTYSIQEKVIPYKVIYRYSPELTGKQERVLRDGKEGIAATIFKTEQNGPFEQQQQLGKAFYAPINKIVEISPAREEAVEAEREQVEGNEGKEPHEIDVDSEGQPLAPEGEKPLTDKAGRPVVQ